MMLMRTFEKAAGLCVALLLSGVAYGQGDSPASEGAGGAVSERIATLERARSAWRAWKDAERPREKLSALAQLSTLPAELRLPFVEGTPAEWGARQAQPLAQKLRSVAIASSARALEAWKPCKVCEGLSEVRCRDCKGTGARESKNRRNQTVAVRCDHSKACGSCGEQGYSAAPEAWPETIFMVRRAVGEALEERNFKDALIALQEKLADGLAGAPQRIGGQREAILASGGSHLWAPKRLPSGLRRELQAEWQGATPWARHRVLTQHAFEWLDAARKARWLEVEPAGEASSEEAALAMRVTPKTLALYGAAWTGRIVTLVVPLGTEAPQALTDWDLPYAHRIPVATEAPIVPFVYDEGGLQALRHLGSLGVPVGGRKRIKGYPARALGKSLSASEAGQLVKLTGRVVAAPLPEGRIALEVWEVQPEETR